MTIPPDIEAQILRYYHAERWRIGTIAKQLRVHRDTVARVLAQAGLPRIEMLRRPSKIDPYLPFIHETLAKFPTLTVMGLASQPNPTPHQRFRPRSPTSQCPTHNDFI